MNFCLIFCRSDRVWDTLHTLTYSCEFLCQWSLVESFLIGFHTTSSYFHILTFTGWMHSSSTWCGFGCYKDKEYKNNVLIYKEIHEKITEYTKAILSLCFPIMHCTCSVYGNNNRSSIAKANLHIKTIFLS